MKVCWPVPRADLSVACLSEVRAAASGWLTVLLLALGCSGCVFGPRVDSVDPVSTPMPGVATAQKTPTIASCRSADLELGFTDRVVPPTGANPLTLVLTNRSVESCYLDGYPLVAELDDAGRELPFNFKYTGDQVVTSDPPMRVELTPGDAAYATTDKYRCDLGDRDLVRTVQVVPPGDDGFLQVTLPQAYRLGYCGPGDSGSIIFVSPICQTLAATIDYGGQRARAQATRDAIP
jgi:hypothetical protein